MNTRTLLTTITETEVTPETSEAHAHHIPSRIERFVLEHQSCAMCESELEISHDINKAELKVKEEAHCPSCGIRVRSSHHLMQ